MRGRVIEVRVCVCMCRKVDQGMVMVLSTRFQDGGR